MIYYQISYDELVQFDTWREKWEVNLDYLSLIDWLNKYINGEMVYSVLNDVYETDCKINTEEEAKKGKKVTKLLDWSSKLPQRKIAKIKSREAFIVHGKDEKLAFELAWILERYIGLIPIILREKSDDGATIIEKLEKHSDVKFAFVILTPDDVGSLANKSNALKPRARQNVIFELGYFFALLGRKNVCCLLQGDIELPSDISGIIYKSFKSSVRECIFDLVKDLISEGAGLQIFPED